MVRECFVRKQSCSYKACAVPLPSYQIAPNIGHTCQIGGFQTGLPGISGLCRGAWGANTGRGRGSDGKRTFELAGSHSPPSPKRTPFPFVTTKTKKIFFPCLKKQSSIGKYANSLLIYIQPLLKSFKNDSLRCLNVPPAFLFNLLVLLANLSFIALMMTNQPSPVWFYTHLQNWGT